MNDETGGAFFIGGEGEIPDELKALLQRLTGVQPPGQDRIEEVLKPTAEQYKLGPGDLCMIINNEKEFHGTTYQLFKVMDPEQEEYQEKFPDWEERLMNSYLFGEWTEEDVPDDTIPGWVSRVQLLKIEDWQWDVLVAHNRGEKPVQAEDEWLTVLYGRQLMGLHLANLGHGMPQPLSCGECGEYGVQVEVSNSSRWSSIAGFFPNSEKHEPEAIYTLSTVTTDNNFSGRLHCLACGAKCDYDVDEIPTRILK